MVRKLTQDTVLVVTSDDYPEFVRDNKTILTISGTLNVNKYENKPQIRFH